jgi:hypothetical protein
MEYHFFRGYWSCRSEPRFRSRRDELWRFRFRCSVCPEDLTNLPWSEFVHDNAEGRVKWGTL